MTPPRLASLAESWQDADVLPADLWSNLSMLLYMTDNLTQSQSLRLIIIKSDFPTEQTFFVRPAKYKAHIKVSYHKVA